MRFQFKTLEQQLKDSGFERIGNEPIYEWEEKAFSKHTMQRIGEMLTTRTKYKESKADLIFLRVRPMKRGEQAGNSDYKKQKVIEVYVPK